MAKWDRVRDPGEFDRIVDRSIQRIAAALARIAARPAPAADGG